MSDSSLSLTLFWSWKVSWVDWRSWALTREQALKISPAPQALRAGGVTRSPCSSLPLSFASVSFALGLGETLALCMGGWGRRALFRLRVLELKVLPLMDPLIRYCLVRSCSSLPAHLGFSKTLYQRIVLVFCEDGAN